MLISDTEIRTLQSYSEQERQTHVFYATKITYLFILNRGEAADSHCRGQGFDSPMLHIGGLSPEGS